MPQSKAEMHSMFQSCFSLLRSRWVYNINYNLQHVYSTVYISFSCSGTQLLVNFNQSKRLQNNGLIKRFTKKKNKLQQLFANKEKRKLTEHFTDGS